MPVILNLREPKPLRGGLRDVAETLEAGVTDWRGGVQVTSQCGGETFVWGCASTGDDGDLLKPLSSTGVTTEFLSTTLNRLVRCPGVNGRLAGTINDLTRRTAENALERTKWSQLAVVLHGGEIGELAENPSLQSEAVLPDGFTVANNEFPSGFAAAIQGLFDIVCACNDQDIVLHIPLTFMPHLLKDDLVEWDEPSGVYRMGHYEVSFDCYPNVGPDALIAADGPYPDYDPDVDPDPRLAAEDGSEVWIYASSRPIAAIDATDVVEAEFVRTNEFNVEATAGAIVVFDPCCVGATKAAVCPVPAP